MLGLFLRLWHSKGYVIIITIISIITVSIIAIIIINNVIIIVISFTIFFTIIINKRSQMTSKFAKNKEETLKPSAGVLLIFLLHFDLTYLLFC